MKTELKHFTIAGRGFGFSRGWGNGYVVLPIGHSQHGKGYDEIPVDVHGGLTFAEVVDDYMLEWSGGILTEEDLGKYVVGFDTGHYGDNEAKWSETEVNKETIHLKTQLEKL